MRHGGRFYMLKYTIIYKIYSKFALQFVYKKLSTGRAY